MITTQTAMAAIAVTSSTPIGLGHIERGEVEHCSCCDRVLDDAVYIGQRGATDPTVEEYPREVAER